MDRYLDRFEAALANFTSIAQQLEQQYPSDNRNQGANVRTLSDAIIGEIRPILLVLLAGACLLLLIAGVNVVGLLLVRSESRKREFFEKLKANLANENPIQEDRMIDEFRSLILRR